ncbi:hypothetical protein [Nocardia anaemiae]|uniref:hypothetical protein n=1 Tax=Nocardia anaemiae TaxID=263910 RepID=UPI0012F4F71B|nr:hypothetical protein [Nocardia anaemiae]
MTNSEFVNSSRSRGKARTPLGVVSATFDRIAGQSLPVDPRPAPGPPRSQVEVWDGLRALLRDPGLPIAAVDAIWVWLIERSRTHGGDATLVCASLAEPMLAGMAGLFAAPGGRHRDDLESEVLTGFLTHLGCVELDLPGVWHRLRWAAYRAAIRAANQQPSVVSVADLERDLGSMGEQRLLMVAGPGHPETVLAEAVAAGVISAEAAELIAVSRWERRTLTSLAAERGQSLWKLRKQRRRAEARLVAWLTDRAHDLGRTSIVEAHAMNTLAPIEDSGPAPERVRQRRKPPLTPSRSATRDGEVRPCA